MKTQSLKKAQSIIEFSIAFILLSFFAYFVLECAFYYQSFHGTQTFSDEINANLVLFGNDTVCSGSKNSAILSLVNERAKKYFKKDIELKYSKASENFLEITSNDTFHSKPLLNVEITCNPTTGGISTKSSYLYSGPFLFRVGEILSSSSSVESPKF